MGATKKETKTKKALDVSELSLRQALSNPEIVRYAKNIRRIQTAYKELQKQQCQAAGSVR